MTVILGAPRDDMLAIEACAHLPAGDRCVTLLDNGSTTGDRAGDGVMVGRIEGPIPRFVDLELRDPTTGEAWFRQIVSLPGASDAVVSFEAGRVDGKLGVERAAFVPYLCGVSRIDDPTALIVGGVWMSLGLLWIGLLTVLGRRWG